MREFQGEAKHISGSVAVVVSRFNESITSKLLDGAIEGLQAGGVPQSWVDVVHVPGAFELPLMVEELIKTGRYVGVVALGAVILGETPHFDYVCEGCTHGLMQVMLRHQTPVSFGVLTTDTPDQALARCGGVKGNKGTAAAATLLEVLSVRQKVERQDG